MWNRFASLFFKPPVANELRKSAMVERKLAPALSKYTKLESSNRAKDDVNTSKSADFHTWMLKQNKLENPVEGSLISRSKASSRVYYQPNYFGSNESLKRLLTKTAAVSVHGDAMGNFRDGAPFGKVDYFSRLQDGSENGLSPDERLLASKKIQASKSWAFSVGGYPYNNPRKKLDTPFPVGIFSLSGSQFENAYLQARMFFLDKYQKQITLPDTFNPLYDDTPTTYEQALKELGEYDVSENFQRLRLGFSFLTRSSDGNFGHSLFRGNSVIFHSTAYYRYVLEDVALLLNSVNHMAQEEGKPAYLKATLVGMGFFAKVDGCYDIHHALMSNYFRAFKSLLEKNDYPHIAKIEFPIFDENDQQSYGNVFDEEEKINGIEVNHMSRDVLAFTNKELNDYFVCAVNPSDSNSYPGNEWGDGSVESACFGNNTTLRVDQVDVANPDMLTRTVALDNEDGYIHRLNTFS
jgi:Domain of unknown function (DUF4804)